MKREEGGGREEEEGEVRLEELRSSKDVWGGHCDLCSSTKDWVVLPGWVGMELHDELHDVTM